MYEHVLTALVGLNKAETLRRVEPFHRPGRHRSCLRAGAQSSPACPSGRERDSTAARHRGNLPHRLLRAETLIEILVASFNVRKDPTHVRANSFASCLAANVDDISPSMRGMGLSQLVMRRLATGWPGYGWWVRARPNGARETRIMRRSFVFAVDLSSWGGRPSPRSRTGMLRCPWWLSWASIRVSSRKSPRWHC